MPRRKDAPLPLLDQIDRAKCAAARKLHLALSNLHNLRTALEQDAKLDKDTQLRLITEAEDAIQEVEAF